MAVMAAVVLCGALSCEHKGLDATGEESGEEIRFWAEDSAFKTEATKAITGTGVVESLTQFYVSCTTGTLGAENEKWSSVSFTGPTNTLYTGHRFWPHEDEGLHFFAANGPIVFHSSSPTIAAVNTKDFVAAYLPDPVFRQQNLLTFDHIFGRIGTVTITAMPEYEVTDVTVKLTPKVSGTYNIRTGAGQTNGTGWSDTASAAAAETIFSATSINSITAVSSAAASNDLWLVPGTYAVYASWTASRDWNSATNAYDYVREFTDVPATINVVAGKVNAVTATIGGAATEIEFTTHVAPWGAESYDASFSSAADGRQYLTFESTSTNTVAMSHAGGNAPVIYYSYNLIDWTEWNGSALTTTTAKPLYVCGMNTGGLSSSSTKHSKFVLGGNGTVKCRGNVMSLLNYTTPPTTTPSDGCFYGLFSGCSLLTVSPNLPATGLSESCYDEMFSGCTALAKAPALPASTLAANCYRKMFHGCSSLSSSPELMAQTLVSGCYGEMFSGCSSLSRVVALFTTDISSSEEFTGDWLKGVKASGTLIKSRVAGWSKSGASGVPSGWTTVLYGQE